MSAKFLLLGLLPFLLVGCAALNPAPPASPDYLCLSQMVSHEGEPRLAMFCTPAKDKADK